jgi:hypothetical protein
VSQAGNGHEPSARAIAPTVRARRRAGTARGDLRELQRLVRVLEHHVAVNEVDVQRDLELLADPDAVVHAEPRLRAVTALLVSLSTYRQVTAAARARPRRAVAVAREPVRAGASAGQINGTRGGGASDTAVTHPNGTARINGGQVNGRYVNGTRGEDGPAGAGASDRELAAATARYIARDLAARQLSEFTSAEGYRLARSLARLGGVEEPVERLLAEANKVRLHPMPLADAVSHSPLGR